MSIGSVLNMAREGMNAQQLQIQVASQNISNAQTDGYSRKRVQLEASLSTVYPYGTLGTGVQVKTIERARDALLDASYRSESADQSNAETTSATLQQIQGVFGEPSDSGLSAAFDAFWSAWDTLANDPTNGAAKSAVREAGNTVAGTLNRFASQIDTIDAQNRQATSADVDTVNSLAKQVGEYNRQIVAAESNGNQDGDLRDARDRLIDQISTLTGATVVPRDNGSVAMFVAGRMLLDGTMVKSLQFNNTTTPSVTFTDGPTPIANMGGKLGAEIDAATNQIPSVMSKLDTMTSTLVTTVNGIHSSGKIFTGNPPVASSAGNFFAVTNPPSANDPLLTARNVKLDPSLTSGAQIASAGSSATGPGNNAVAMQLAALRDTQVSFSSGATSLGSMSIGDFYNGAVNDVATKVQHADDEATVQGTLVASTQTRRQSVSGVSTDEELINVIQFQHAYQAAARLVSVVDEMTQTLVDLGR